MRDGEFAALLETHAGLLARIAASYEAQPAARDDLVQDISLALWRALPTWRGDASLRTFVARVAHNRGASHVARQVRHRGEPYEDSADTSPAIDPQQAATQQQRHERLLRALRRLPLGQRQVVTLALDGFAHREIAQALGLTVNAVGVRLSRARRALGRLLEAS